MPQDDEFMGLANPYATPHLLPDDPISDASDNSEFNPLRTIWTQPRKTIRRVVAVNPQLHVLPLVCLAGIGEALDRASMRNAGDTISLEAIIAIACLLGPIGGLLSLWISSHLIRFSGAWIGGTASRLHIKTAIAWASVPTVFGLPLWAPQFLLFGTDVFTSETPRLDAQPWLLIPFLAIVLAELILGVWSFVLLCNTIAETQGFHSAWRGLGNLVLAGALIFVPLIGLVLFVAALAALM